MLSRIGRTVVREALNKLIPFMVRQAHHERNQQLTVRPEPVEGFNQRFLSLNVVLSKKVASGQRERNPTFCVCVGLRFNLLYLAEVSAWAFMPSALATGP